MHPPPLFPTRRPRRNRSTESWRLLGQETYLLPHQLVYPVFVTEEATTPIRSMPGIFRFSLSDLLGEIEEAMGLGIKALNLFCHVPEAKKDPIGSEAYQENTLLTNSITAIKTRFPDLLLMADIALDPFTSHGLDGIIDEKGYVKNDATLVALAKMAIKTAEAGVDIISPSDMMDGRIAYLRRELDEKGFTQVGILSYAVKYASSFYAPFREALDSAPRTGDKKTFQLNPANSREALLECLLDDQECADMLLIKPALTSLDIIAKLRNQTLLPIGAYHVSGEYAMLKAAAKEGFLSYEATLLESLMAIRRAGADFILTYGAKDAARILYLNKQ